MQCTAMSGRLDWQGTDRVIVANMRQYEQRVYEAIRAVASHFAPILESEAKLNAPWVDRTSNARQTLNAFVTELATDIVSITLAHGMDYGKFLEFSNQGRYQIIMPTLEQNYAPIMQMLREIFS